MVKWEKNSTCIFFTDSNHNKRIFFIKVIRGGSRNSVFFKAMGSGAAIGSWSTPWWGTRGEAPASSLILVILVVKFKHTVSIIVIRIFFQSNLFVYYWAVISVHLFVFLGFEPQTTYSYSHHVLSPLPQQTFLVFLHKNIITYKKLMHNFGEEKIKPK